MSCVKLTPNESLGNDFRFAHNSSENVCSIFVAKRAKHKAQKTGRVFFLMLSFTSVQSYSFRPLLLQTKEFEVAPIMLTSHGASDYHINTRLAVDDINYLLFTLF